MGIPHKMTHASGSARTRSTLVASPTTSSLARNFAHTGGIIRIARRLLAILLGTALLAYAQGNTFDKVRYNGGTVSTKVNPKDWNNKLTITPDLILLTLKDGQKAEIDPKSVTAFSYGQEAHRRVGTMIALAVLVAPVALFGLFHKTRLHFIGIQYKTADGKVAACCFKVTKITIAPFSLHCRVSLVFLFLSAKKSAGSFL